MRTLLKFLFLLCFTMPAALADVRDPYDPFDQLLPEVGSEEEDLEKSADELLLEAELLMIEERLLDARTKMLRALKKAPNDFRVHMMLSSYYLVEVGHFRLALRYSKRALELFAKDNGPAPYNDPLLQRRHSYLLNVLSQVRLNLDNYEGALDALNEYSGFGYMSEWYPSSRAWILMKLGRLDEAIRTAKLGMLATNNPTRTLNVLGILLSMNNQRQESLRVFERAIVHEFSLGGDGKPATPLNNAGEVYREIFEEDNAEKYWLRATALPDGCDHVLPSLNLAILYIEQTKYSEAKQAMDRFESCIAQFPLRNGEEHRALVHLARGRVDLHAGHVDSALEHLEDALERRQWFGKIGASGDDLRVGALISYGQALDRKNAHERTRLKSGITDRFESLMTRAQNRIKSWWSMRRARQLLAEDLNEFEDIYVRHTDSVLEYPTLGEALAGFPKSVLKARIDEESQKDDRPRASPYYEAYLAENLLAHGRKSEGLKLLGKALSSARSKYDQALSLHLMSLRMRYAPMKKAERRRAAESIFLLSRAALRNYGLKLPVNYEVSTREALELLKKTTFEPDNEPLTDFSVKQTRLSDGKYRFTFSSRLGSIPEIRVQGEELTPTINEFTRAVFSKKLG